MADNITLDPGVGGSVVAADDIGSVYHQLVKVEFGADGSATQVDATHGLPVGLMPQTSGGCSFKKFLSLANTNAVEVKDTAGQIYAIYATNINAAVRYLKIYNLADSNVTPGTSVPAMTFPIPANAAGAGFFLSLEQGIAMGTGISFNLTTGVADNDNVAVAANEITVTVFYK